ncbi:MAG: S41 family peptidase [Gemmataceae bacterium]
MASTRCVRLGSKLAILALFVAFLSATTLRADQLEDLRKTAQRHEANGDYGKACSYYAAILAKDRTLTEIKQRFHLCLRHFHRGRRHQDETYRNHVLKQDPKIALKVYAELVRQVHGEYHEESRVGYQRLFRQGLEEFKLSLEDARFRQLYLPNASAEAVARFTRRLQHDWRDQLITDLVDLEQPVLQVALAAKKDLGVQMTVTVLELACGACNALDEHTCYVPPKQYEEDFGSLRGQTAGVGIELAAVEDELIVTQVVINSPASRAGVIAGDRLVRVDRQPVEHMPLDEIHAKLRGKPGTTIQLDIVTGMSEPRTFTLVRLPIQASVTDYRIADMDAGVGYVQISCFHENTLAELEDAITQLEMQGMKVLILDLRGNYGGLVESARLVAEKFLWEGALIYSTKGRDQRPVKMHSRNVAPSRTPLVVLVDGTTASAAEILAGALKDNSRATLVGENTFGKGTVQQMLAVKTIRAGGIRFTYAKVYSPENRTYNESGVSPHVFIERNSFSDEQNNEARLIARQIAGMAR